LAPSISSRLQDSAEGEFWAPRLRITSSITPSSLGEKKPVDMATEMDGLVVSTMMPAEVAEAALPARSREAISYR
jgi:hypothetical protein